MTKRATVRHRCPSTVKNCRLSRKSVLRMLKLMSGSDEDGSDTVKDFLTTGRVGRRNALPDILSDHALTNTAELPDKLTQLTIQEYPQAKSNPQNEASSADDKTGETKIPS